MFGFSAFSEAAVADDGLVRTDPYGGGLVVLHFNKDVLKFPLQINTQIDHSLNINKQQDHGLKINTQIDYSLNINKQQDHGLKINKTINFNARR